MGDTLQKDKAKTIAILGLGYVGLPLAQRAAQCGWAVVGYDTNTKVIAKLKTVESKQTADPLFTSNANDLRSAQVYIICVPTPVDSNKLPNLEYVSDAAKTVAKYLQKGNTVILESTVNPGVTEEIVLPILQTNTQMKGERDFYIAHCPERVNPGDEKWAMENIPRVIGGLGKNSLNKAAAVYRTILNAPVHNMGSLKEAEAVKIVENTFRDINIAFVNELAMSFDILDIDVMNVLNGASTKPFGFMAHYPGIGVGGHCIPVDPYYLIEKAKSQGFGHKFISLAREINESMPKYTVKIALRELKKIGISNKKAKIVVLGLAYKPDIKDIRESPAIKLIDILKEEGISPKIYDPHQLGRSNCATLSDAITDVDVIILATAHSEFRNLSPELLDKCGVKLFIDGRNAFTEWAFNKSMKMTYKGIGVQAK